VGAVTASRLGRALGRWTRADWLVAVGAGIAVAAAARAGFVAEGNLRVDVPGESGLQELAVQAGNVDPTSLVVLAVAQVLVLLGLLSRPVRFEAAMRPVAFALALLAGLGALFALAVLALSRLRLALTQTLAFGPLAAVLGAVAAAALALSAAAREQP
jgi:hypothetical protein